MMLETLKKGRYTKDINQVYLVGEVVDYGVMPRSKKLDVRARLKLRLGNKKEILVDVIGKKECSEIMSLVCQSGNIVYVEGEFRNSSLDKVSIAPFVLVKHIECLLRRKNVAPPDEDIIDVLNKLDPIGYYEKETKPRKRKRRER